MYRRPALWAMICRLQPSDPFGEKCVTPRALHLGTACKAPCKTINVNVVLFVAASILHKFQPFVF